MPSTSPEQLILYFRNQDDWTGRTPGEFRKALECAMWKQTYANLNEQEWQQVLPKYKSELEYAMWAMSSTAFPFFDRPNLSTTEMNAVYADMALDRHAKRNFFVGYMNTYLYAYIHNIELKNLHDVIEGNKDIPIEWLVDHFLTVMVFIDVVKANPGMQFEYHQIADVPASRVSALEQVRTQIIAAYRKNDEPELFKLIFYAMTHFAGSTYRGIHKGLMVEIYGFQDLSVVRDMFNQNVETLIKNQGRPNIGTILPH